MVAVGGRNLGGRDQAVALHPRERRAHRRRHRGEAGLGPGLRVHRVDLLHHAQPLGREVLRFDAFSQRDLRKEPKKQTPYYFTRLSLSMSA